MVVAEIINAEKNWYKICRGEESLIKLHNIDSPGLDLVIASKLIKLGFIEVAEEHTFANKVFKFHYTTSYIANYLQENPPEVYLCATIIDNGKKINLSITSKYQPGNHQYLIKTNINKVHNILEKLIEKGNKPCKKKINNKPFSKVIDYEPGLINFISHKKYK